MVPPLNRCDEVDGPVVASDDVDCAEVTAGPVVRVVERPVSDTTHAAFDLATVNLIQRALRDWAAAGQARDFPWRQPLPLWKALVAEVMLLRTRAKQVAPSFEAFNRRYLTPSDFAAASEDELRTLLLNPQQR